MILGQAMSSTECAAAIFTIKRQKVVGPADIAPVLWHPKKY
jgi:hypothetical protein